MKKFAVLYYIRSPREWEDGSVDKMLVGKYKKLSLDPQNLCKTGDRSMYLLSQLSQELETGEFLETWRPASLAHTSVNNKRPYLKQGKEITTNTRLVCHNTYYMHAHIHIHEHLCTYIINMHTKIMCVFVCVCVCRHRNVNSLLTMINTLSIRKTQCIPPQSIHRFTNVCHQYPSTLFFFQVSFLSNMVSQST